MADECVVISGASRGIGHALAKECRQRGYDVIGIARSFSGHPNEIRSSGLGCLNLYGDVTSVTDVDSICETMRRRGLRPSIVIAAAGIGAFAPFIDIEIDNVRAMLETNVIGVAILFGAFLRAFPDHPITFCALGSLAGCRAFPRGAGYCASKFALRGLCEALRMELQSTQSRVVLVNPGLVDTQFFPDGDDNLLRQGIPPDSLAAMIMEMLGNRQIEVAEIMLRSASGTSSAAFKALIEAT